jgi:hypothetical protein
MLNNKEFYISNKAKLMKTQTVMDIKGFGDSIEDVRKAHSKYLLSDLTDIFSFIDTNIHSKYGRRVITEYLKAYCRKYLEFEVPLETYKELHETRYNLWRLKSKVADFNIYLSSISEDILDRLDISYNYMRYLLPLLSLCS